MTLVIATVGKDAIFKVATTGTATTECIGTENLKVTYNWETVKKMFLNTSAKTTIPTVSDFNITGQITLDSAGDAGQAIIKTAAKNASNIAFMIYPGTATATTTTYMCTAGIVTKYEPSVDPLQPNTVSFTIEPNGVALTLPA